MPTRAEREKLALLEEKRLEKEEKKRLLQEKRALRDARKAEKMETSTMNSSHVGESVENADEGGESGVNGGSREGGDEDEDEEEILSKEELTKEGVFVSEESLFIQWSKEEELRLVETFFETDEEEFETAKARWEAISSSMHSSSQYTALQCMEKYRELCLRIKKGERCTCCDRRKEERRETSSREGRRKTVRTCNRSVSWKRKRGLKRKRKKSS